MGFTEVLGLTNVKRLKVMGITETARFLEGDGVHKDDWSLMGI